MSQEPSVLVKRPSGPMIAQLLRSPASTGPASPRARAPVSRRRAALAIGVIAATTFLAMSVWFSASVVAGQLQVRWDMSTAQRSLFTIAVQVGFAGGALGLAASGLADSLGARALVSGGALLAAASNLALLWAPGATGGLALRMLTGVCLAAVYPSALKEVSTWSRHGRGMALGVMMSALTLGSALPHLVSAAGGVHWRTVICATSALAAMAGALFIVAGRPGPYPYPRTAFRLREALDALRDRAVVLVNVGYAGHMWELYAMWAGIAAFLGTVRGLADPVTISLVAFCAIAIGAVGCPVAGVLGDRVGRPATTALCMVCSGGAAVALAFAHGGPVWLVIALCLFWGFWVIADSAQLSALMSEHADPRYVGSAMAFQLAAGYVVTVVTLWLTPLLADRFSWAVVLAVLAIGPGVGAVAMLALGRATAGTGAVAR